MPFLKFSRDKRGGENLYLVEPTNRRGRSRQQILYWFHTPPNVKVGREPFDASVRRALEAQYPHLRFDWPRLLDIHIPPPEVQEWRERRRAMRAAKQAADEEEAADNADAEKAAPPSSPAVPVSEEAVQAATDGPVDGHAGPDPEAPVAQPQAIQDSTASGSRRRRRRRGRRRGQQGAPAAASGQGPASPQADFEPEAGKPDPEDAL